jgi:DNA topoisomerase-1
MSYLLIVESPGKIKKISEYLGDDYIVMASVGHIIDIHPSPKNNLSVNLETFEPIYSRNHDKLDVINKLCKQADRVGNSNVLLAADEDREGEMIAWSLAKELELNNAKRIVFNSITKKELEKAISHPQKIDLNMVYAQQSRRILDRLAGFIISPILSNTHRGAKSAGRVQSVVVKIVLNKEKEIEKFYSNKSDSFFTINTDITMGDYEFNSKLYNKTDKVDFNIEDTEFDDLDEKTDEDSETKPKKNKTGITKTKQKSTDNSPSKGCVIFTKDEEPQVIEIIKNMTKADYKLLKMSERIRKANPPAPFTTSTLQQVASQRLGMDAKRTMMVAQKLYEAGYITYMRTDSTAISEEAMLTIKEEIESKYGIKYYDKKEYKNKKGNTQEAHECVRPTKIQYDTVEGTSDEKRLYSMIWKRTIQSQMKAAEYQNITVEIEMLNRKLLVLYKLVGNLENLIFSGYLIVDEKKSSTPLDIESIKKLVIKWENINGIEDTQKPPVRYNDASLINKMDPKNLNIGRPSTYATIIDKIISRNYVEVKDIEGKDMELNRYNVSKKEPKSLNMETKTVKIGKEKKKLVPTDLGRKATEFLEKYFTDLMDYNFTANMEKQLDDVAEGKINKLKVIKPLYEYIQQQIKTIPVDIAKTNNYKQPEKIGKYDKFDVVLHDGPYGKYVSCDNYKFNLNMLFNVKKQLDDDDLKAELEELEKTDILNDKNSDDPTIASNETILKKTLEKIENLKQQIEKEWKIGKKKYILKKQFGYYIEEWNTVTKKKSGNYSMKFLMDKIAKNNKLDINTNDDLKQIINKITNKDIEDTIEYFSKSKKNTGVKKFVKKE